jgi:hypothetical protein
MANLVEPVEPWQLPATGALDSVLLGEEACGSEGLHTIWAGQNGGTKMQLVKTGHKI